MSKFIILHDYDTKKAGRFNVDHITVYGPEANGTPIALLDYDNRLRVTETTEEIDKLIEEAEAKDPKITTATRLLDEYLGKILAKPVPPGLTGTWPFSIVAQPDGPSDYPPPPAAEDEHTGEKP